MALVIDPHKKVELATDALGTVVVGRLTAGALIQLSPELDSKTPVPDDVLVRSLFGAVARLPGTESSSGLRELTKSEVDRISDADLDQFAEAFMRLEGWHADSDGSAVKSDRSVNEVARALRAESERITKNIRESFKSFSNVFSDNTRNLIMQSSMLGERLRDLASMSHVNVSQIVSDSRPQLPPINFSNTHAQRTAESLADINHKTDRAMEIAETISAMHAKTNEALLQGLNDFAKKHQADERSAKRNLRTAMVALVITAILSAISIFQNYLSGQDSADQSRKTEQLMQKQTDALDKIANSRRSLTGSKQDATGSPPRTEPKKSLAK